tara:strand:+ start:158380 stop:158667 length:288 start_codon:yes stop_codon:yes gene_type:complete
MKLNIQKLESKINEINNEIDVFQRKMSNVPTNVTHDLKKIVNELESKKSNFKDKIDLIKDKSDDAVVDMQIGVEMAWKDLSIAYDSVKERFKEVG